MRHVAYEQFQQLEIGTVVAITLVVTEGGNMDGYKVFYFVDGERYEKKGTYCEESAEMVATYLRMKGYIVQIIHVDFL